ncbi:MAG: hypothetical protein ABEI80_08825 [Haloplanus sp.]
MQDTIELEFRHALYDFQGRQSGQALVPSEAAAALKKLVDGADAALYRTQGHFFDTLGTDPRMFVFGRLVEWDDVRAGECFFDLYATALANVRDIPLDSLAAALEDAGASITDKRDPIDESVSVTVPADPDRASTPGETGAPSWAGDGGTTAAMADADVRLVADFWERWRRDETPIRLQMSELDRLVALVSGLLPRVSYVSRVPEGGDPYYFTLAGGHRDEPAGTDHLRATIRERANGGRLSWDDLPTYEERLDTLIEAHEVGTAPSDAIREERNAIDERTSGVGRRLSEAVAPADGEADEDRDAAFYRAVWTLFERTYLDVMADIEGDLNETARDLYEGALDPERSIERPDEDDGMISGLLGGDDTPERTRRVARDIAAETDHVDEELATVIAERIAEDLDEAITEAVERRIREDLRDGLDERISDRTRRIALRTAKRIDDVRDSRAYRHLHGDGVDARE